MNDTKIDASDEKKLTADVDQSRREFDDEIAKVPSAARRVSMSLHAFGVASAAEAIFTYLGRRSSSMTELENKQVELTNHVIDVFKRSVTELIDERIALALKQAGVK